MIKNTIVLGLLGCVLLLTGCGNMHPIDDIPNHDTSSFKRTTVIYPNSNRHIFRNVESDHHSSYHRERDRIIGFQSDVN